MGLMGGSQSGNEPGSKRWTGPLAAACAVILLFAAFPNPLRRAPDHPGALAEYAPVSRSNVPPAPQANFSETDLPSSAGIGAGIGGTPVTPVRKLPQYVPHTHECVGSPPRQTEDPLSPPCVPAFLGSNGGATWRGVTRDEIRVLLYNDWGLEGEMSTPYDPKQEPDAGGSIRFSPEAQIVRTVKAHLRYFQRRFQTYGRRVRVFAQPSQGVGTSCEQRRGDATLGDSAAGEAFAALDFSHANATCFLDQIAMIHRVMTFGVNWHLPPEVYARNAPLIYGFYPDQGIEASWSAAVICRSLRNGQAAYSADGQLRNKPRRFGLIHEGTRKYEYYQDHLWKRLIDALDRRCGFHFDEIVEYKPDTVADDGVMRRFKEAEITTVVCHCDANRIADHQMAAELELYHPEWFFDHGSGVLLASAARDAIRPSQRSFGVTHFWQLPRLEEQYHYRAYRTEEPDVGPNASINFHVYMQLLNLFTGIQAAGPRLTPQSVKRGMFSFMFTDQAEARQPTGGYGPYGPKAVGQYTFIDTAAIWWWDPSGTEPGRDRDGCIRLSHRGRRFYASEIPKDLLPFDVTSSSCTADPQTWRGGRFL